MSTRSTIVPYLLNNDNYQDWRVFMENYLRSHGLWDFVTKDPFLYRIEERWEFEGNFQKYNHPALHAIQISCSQEIFAQIKGIVDAKEAWKKLANMHKEILQYEYILQYEARSGREEMSMIERADGVELAKSITKGDWDAVRRFGDKYPIHTTLLNRYQTALQLAISTGQDGIAEELVRIMSETDVRMQNFKGDTALSLAAFQGRTSIVKCLVQKNHELLTIENGQGNIPVLIACDAGQVEVTNYLYSLTPLHQVLLPENGNLKVGFCLMRSSINNNMLDISLDLLRRNPSLAVTTDSEVDGQSPILTLSEQSSAFYSGSRLSFWQQWIYQWLKVQQLPARDTPMSHQSHNNEKNIIRRILGIKEIYDLKLRHMHALEVLRCMCNHVSTFNFGQRDKCGVVVAATEAAKRGTFEFFIEIWKANPLIINFSSNNNNGRQAMMVAIQHRQAKVFNLFYGLHDARKAEFVSTRDYNKNTMLHVAGELAPDFQLAQISGAALQMQRELQWFKEVEKIVPTWCKEAKNNDGHTPQEVFTKSHKELLKEGEKWMKDTASSFIIVGTLIVTIMFAVAFTVPGGNDQNTGFPIFLSKKTFKIFLISDAISFFAASTSVLMFLGILTSRYAEGDFLIALPTKLIIGLSALFVSTTAMMVSFCTALVIMLHGRWWAIILIIVMAIIPITLFVWLQFPLLIRIFVSTYFSRIFNKKMKL